MDCKDDNAVYHLYCTQNLKEKTIEYKIKNFKSEKRALIKLLKSIISFQIFFEELESENRSDAFLKNV